MPFGQLGLTKLPILYRLEGEVPPAEQRFESMDIPVKAAGLESHKPQATYKTPTRISRSGWRTQSRGVARGYCYKRVTALRMMS